MADFNVSAGRFTVQVNDGHFTETYEIDAASTADAIAEARRLWARRPGGRAAPTYDMAMAMAHKEESARAATEEHEETEVAAIEYREEKQPHAEVDAEKGIE